MIEHLEGLFMFILQLLLLFLNPVILIPAIITVLVFVKKNKEYKSGAYYQVTKLSYLSVCQNPGRYGEYLIYQHLKYMEANGAKFLFNVYIPKGNGETTEIDVLMICSKGIFVFESKNYSGWIFGSETQKNWHQTLPAGRRRRIGKKSHKEDFYNPIMQNRSHIKHLESLLGNHFATRSIIVFSDRCTLKNLQIKSNNTSVIKLHSVAPVVFAIYNQMATDVLSESNITELYNKLYPFTQVDGYTKIQHIAHIRSNLNGQPVRQTTAKNVPPVATALKSEVNTGDIETVETDVQSPSAELTSQITVDPRPIMEQIPKCPKCNGNLVLRTARRGANSGNQFYGCSNYPTCRYIQNITNKTV